MCPYFAAYCRDGIAEGENRFWIPCGCPWFELSRFGEVMRAKRDNGEQSQQGWCGAQDRLVGPLTLRFDAEMRADFLEGNLDLPAAHEPSENVARTGVEIGGEEGLRVEVAFGIATEQPADRHRRHAATIPDRGAAGDLDEAIGSSVPETDAAALPAHFAILEDSRELLQALAFYRRPGAGLMFFRPGGGNGWPQAAA